jgi:hypothetical protein
MAEPDRNVAEIIMVIAAGVSVVAATGCLGSVLWLIWSMGAIVSWQTLGSFVVVLVAALVVGGISSNA